jgi:hypothetical protein
MNSIIAPHIDNEKYFEMSKNSATSRGKMNNDLQGASNSAAPSKFQSVQEESDEVSDSSSNEKRPAKRANKPSKRSRFE